MTDDIYYKALRIRMVEERIAQEYPKGQIRCPVHLSIGQEGAAVGVCSVLRPQDKMVSTHRGHAHYLAKGGSLKGLIGELYGKSTGCSRGMGGSMHLIDLDANFYGSTSIVGGTVPVGVGLAFADKLRGSDAITVICIGDAALEQGVFHEAANFAGLHKLRVLFVCENNKFSCYTHINERQPASRRGAGGIRALGTIAQAHGLSYTKTYPSVGSIEHITRMALNKLPHFIQIPTWRYLQHCGPDNDDHLNYRRKSEINRWKRRDWERAGRNIDYALAIKPEIDEAFDHAKQAPPAEMISAYAD